MAYLFILTVPRCKVRDCHFHATHRLVGANLRLVGLYCRRHAGAELAAQHERERRAREEVGPGA